MMIHRVGYNIASRVLFPKVISSAAKQTRLTAAFSSTAAAKNSTTITTTTRTTRPFTILGVQQIAIGSEDRAGLSKLWQDIFGFQKTPNSPITIDSENVTEDILKVGLPHFPVEIDLMTPIDPEKSPKVHKPPLNHIGLWVDDLPIAVEWMKQQGVRFTPGGIRKGAAGYNVTFIHPKAAVAVTTAASDNNQPDDNRNDPVVPDSISGCGVLIELVQAPPEIIAEYNQQ